MNESDAKRGSAAGVALRRLRRGSAAAALALAGVNVAHAAEEGAGLGASAVSPQAGQRQFGVLASIGSYSGLGAGVQVGSPALGARLLAGWSPLLLAVQRPEDDTVSLEFFSSFVLAPDVYVAFFESKRGTHAGAQLGYRYDTLLKHGFAAGGFAGVPLSRSFDVVVQGGFVVFPNGEDEVLADESSDIPAGTDFSFPGPNVSFGVSVALAFFP